MLYSDFFILVWIKYDYNQISLDWPWQSSVENFFYRYFLNSFPDFQFSDIDDNSDPPCFRFSHVLLHCEKLNIRKPLAGIQVDRLLGKDKTSVAICKPWSLAIDKQIYLIASTINWIIMTYYMQFFPIHLIFC